MRFIKILVLIPIAAIIILFSIANKGLVTVSLNPFPADAASTEMASLTYQMPLYLLIFLALLVGVLLGGVASWISQGKWRKKARDNQNLAARERHRAEAVEQQMQKLQPDDSHALPFLSSKS